MKTTVKIVVREVEPDNSVSFEVIFGADVNVDALLAVEAMKGVLDWAKEGV